MCDYIVGIDPDSKKHGVAVYEDGRLLNLKSLNLMELQDNLKCLNSLMDFDGSIEVHIENVDANKGNWHNTKSGKSSFGRSSSDMGKCRQAYIEVVRMCEYLGINVVNHKISKQWKTQQGKKQFELITGWKGRSNEDTRSAAYFGHLGTR